MRGLPAAAPPHAVLPRSPRVNEPRAACGAAHAALWSPDPRCRQQVPGNLLALRSPATGCRRRETPARRRPAYTSQHAPRRPFLPAPPPTSRRHPLGLQVPACCAPRARRRLTVRPRGLRFPACPAPRGRRYANAAGGGGSSALLGVWGSQRRGPGGGT